MELFCVDKAGTWALSQSVSKVSVKMACSYAVLNIFIQFS